MPYTPVTLGLRFNIRLSDLTAADVLRVTSPRCGKRHDVAPHALLARFSLSTRLVDIEAKMRCKGCPYVGPMRWQIERATPPFRVI